MMESVPEIAGSIMVFEMVEPDVGSVGNGYRNEGFDKRMLGVSETGRRAEPISNSHRGAGPSKRSPNVHSISNAKILIKRGRRKTHTRTMDYHIDVLC